MAVEDAVTVEPVGEFALNGIRRPLAACNVLATASPHQLWTAFKNDAQIIGGHCYRLCQGKTVTLRQVCDLGDVP